MASTLFLTRPTIDCFPRMEKYPHVSHARFRGRNVLNIACALRKHGGSGIRQSPNPIPLMMKVLKQVSYPKKRSAIHLCNQNFESSNHAYRNHDIHALPPLHSSIRWSHTRIQPYRSSYHRIRLHAARRPQIHLQRRCFWSLFRLSKSKQSRRRPPRQKMNCLQAPTSPYLFFFFFSTTSPPYSQGCVVLQLHCSRVLPSQPAASIRREFIGLAFFVFTKHGLVVMSSMDE